MREQAISDRKLQQRRCVGCFQMKSKEELIRVNRWGGKTSLDYNGKADGRGAYVCRDEACLQKARKKNGFARSLKTAVSSDIYDAIQILIGGG